MKIFTDWCLTDSGEFVPVQFTRLMGFFDSQQIKFKCVGFPKLAMRGELIRLNPRLLK